MLSRRAEQDVAAGERSRRLVDPELLGAAEGDFAARFGLDDAVLTRSGSEGFLAVLLALEVAYGDEVVLPVSICQTMVNAVLLAGAVPVLADCNADLSLSVEDLERRLSARTRVVVCHHPHGLAVDLGPVEAALGRRRDIALVDDAAQALGAHRGGEPVGRRGDFSLFSFAAGKPLAAGVGGLVAARGRRLTERLRAVTRIGLAGYPDDRCLGSSSVPTGDEARHLRQRLRTFDADLERRVAKAEAASRGLLGIGPVVGGDSIGARPYAHVFQRLIVELPTSGDAGVYAAWIDRLRGALPRRLHRAVQETVPRPPHATDFLNRRYRQIGRPELCDPEGRRYPTWNRCRHRYLYLRCDDRVGAADLDRICRTCAATA